MADEGDSLFTLDVVRDFMLAKGGKVSNHDLVNHFKTFLNDPNNKVTNRQKFKEFVNTLAAVKLDESGEKLLVLKRKFRDESTSAATTLKAESHLPKNKPKAKKSKMAEQFEASMVSEAGEDTPQPSSKSKRAKASSKQPEEEPEEADMLADIVQTLESRKISDETETDVSAPDLQVSGFEDTRDEDSVFTDSRETDHSMSEDAEMGQALPERSQSPPPVVISSPDEASQEMMSSEGVTESACVPSVEAAGASAAEPSAAEVALPEAEAEAGAAKERTPSPERPAADGPPESFETPAPYKKDAEDGRAPMSVKQRVEQLKKMESETDLLAVPGGPKRKHHRGSAIDDDSGSASGISLSDSEREWMRLAAKADYHPMAKMLQANQTLARFKEFMSGFTALHWAAKHGNAEVVKLLCGTQNIHINAKSNGGYTALHLAAMHSHEDILELLAKGYGADVNMRDYSGRKPKQYLRNAASARAQQLLQARKLSSAVGASSDNFRRVGSYSTKIKTAGHFGINAGVAVRSSWSAASMTNSDRSGTPSPNPSPRESPQPTRRGASVGREMDTDLMPPPKGAPPRRKRNRSRHDKENHSDSEMPGRAGSEPDLHASSRSSSSSSSKGATMDMESGV